MSELVFPDISAAWGLLTQKQLEEASRWLGQHEPRPPADRVAALLLTLQGRIASLEAALQFYANQGGVIASAVLASGESESAGEKP